MIESLLKKGSDKIMKMKGKKRYIVIGIIVILIVVLVVNMKGGAVLTQVATATVSRGDIESVLSISGTVKEKNKYEVFPETSVKVKSVLIEKNDEVKKGQKILDLDLDTLISSLNTLKINREISELNYEKASLANENGSLSLIPTENSTQNAKDAYERAEALYNAGAVSKVEYDSAKTAYENAKAGLDMAKVSNTNDLEILKKQIELTDIQISELEKQINKLRASMLSPSDGIISTLNAVEGGYATIGVAMYTVINNDELEIVCSVKEFTVKNLQVGQLAYITGDAFDGKTYNGYVKSISSVAEKTMSTSGSQTVIEVIIGITDKETELKSGLNVTADVVIAKKESVLNIPITSFREDKTGETTVFIIENGMLKAIPVEIGINSEEGIEVMSGLEEGQKIVEDIKVAYTDGMKVLER